MVEVGSPFWVLFFDAVGSLAGCRTMWSFVAGSVIAVAVGRALAPDTLTAEERIQRNQKLSQSFLIARKWQHHAYSQLPS